MEGGERGGKGKGEGRREGDRKEEIRRVVKMLKDGKAVGGLGYQTRACKYGGEE